MRTLRIKKKLGGGGLIILNALLLSYYVSFCHHYVDNGSGGGGGGSGGLHFTRAPRPCIGHLTQSHFCHWPIYYILYVPLPTCVGENSFGNVHGKSVFLCFCFLFDNSNTVVKVVTERLSQT